MRKMTFIRKQITTPDCCPDYDQCVCEYWILAETHTHRVNGSFTTAICLAKATRTPIDDSAAVVYAVTNHNPPAPPHGASGAFVCYYYYMLTTPEINPIA